MFAAIYVPDFPVEAILRAEPELRESPVAIIEGTPPLVRVIAVNEKAAAAGIEPGMTKLQAEERLLADVLPGSPTRERGSKTRATHIRQRSQQREAAAHAALLDCACGFSPRVEDTAPDTVLLDLCGLERIFGPPAKIARDIAGRCSELGLEANIAVAANADAAMHAARGFPGVTVIAPGEEAERLGSLPIDVLCGTRAPACAEARTGEGCATPFMEILDTLERWGVRNLRALAALPPIAVTARLGQEGLYWQNLARGTTSRALAPIEPPLRFEESMELEYPVNDLEPLSFLLNRMLEQLCARLAARALAASEVKLRLELEANVDDRVIGSSGDRVIEKTAQITRSPDHQITRSLRLPVPMLDAKVFLKLLQLDLQANPPGAPVLKLWVGAAPAEPRRAQDGLFLPATPEPEQLEVTLAKIKRVVGRVVSPEPRVPSADDHRPSIIDQRPADRVGSPEILDTHRRDAFRMRGFVATDAKSRSLDSDERCGPTNSAGPLPRSSSLGITQEKDWPVTALRVFRPPLAARVALSDGRPARLACPERPAVAGDVTWCAGPWRSSGEWWSEQAWSREEWDVAVGDALYRIYRDTTGWFMQGTYD